MGEELCDYFWNECVDKNLILRNLSIAISDGPIHWGSISERIKELQNEIIRHELLYCVQNNPEISDAKYDELFAELQELEAKHPDLVTQNSPTQRLAPEPESEPKKVEHGNPAPDHRGPDRLITVNAFAVFQCEHNLGSQEKAGG